MKKIIIIGIIIAAFIVWSIVDQPCQPPPRDGIGVERDCYPEPRWIKWTTEINNWHDSNHGFNDMRYVDSCPMFCPKDDFENDKKQIQMVLDSCAAQRLAEAQNYTAADGTVMMVDAIGFNYENSTHRIDNTDCFWVIKNSFSDKD